VTVSAELREFAEVPDRFAPIAEGGSVTRFDDGRVCIIQGPTWASVSGVSVREDEVGDLVSEVRSLIPPGKHTTWWLGPSAAPAELVALLREHGLTTPRDHVGLVRALVLTTEPARPGADVTVHAIETLDDYVAARNVQWDAFSVPEERRSVMRARIEEDFAEQMRVGVPLGLVARLDGRIGATAMAIPSERGVFLIAGATAPWARGRGLYRALVRARWEYAVQRGTPALVTQADPATSYPILKRLGFEDVCEIERLDDLRQSIGTTSSDS
jgi:predicted N-acetyltransferase YhbS